MGFQDLWWNIFVSSLAILAAVVFGDIVRINRQDRQTDTQTNARENRTPGTAVGVGNNLCS